MATLQKALITTYFRLPKEVHEDADITKNRCGKQSDETRVVTPPREGSGSSPAEEKEEEEEEEEEEDEYTTTNRELQRPGSRRKQVVNLFGGLLGQEMCRKKERLLGGRTVSSDCDPLDISSSSSQTEPRDGRARPILCSNVRGPPTDTQMPPSLSKDRPAAVDCTLVCGGDTGTSRRQAMLAFDRTGRLTLGSPTSQQQCHLLEAAGIMQEQDNDLDTQRAVHILQVGEAVKEDEMDELADQHHGPKRRRKVRRRRVKDVEGEENREGAGVEGKVGTKGAASAVIVDKVETMETIDRKSRLRMKKNVCSKDFFSNQDVAELKTIELQQSFTANEGDRLRSRNRNASVLGREDSISLSLSRKKKHCRHSMETEHPVLYDEGQEEGTANTQHCKEEEEIKSDMAAGVGTVEGCVGGKLRRKKRSNVQKQMEGKIHKRVANDIQIPDKPKVTRKRCLGDNDDDDDEGGGDDGGGGGGDGDDGGDAVLAVTLPTESPAHLHGSHRGRHPRHAKDNTLSSCPKGSKVDDVLELTSSSDECDGSLAPVGRAGPASKATPLCGSWADIFKKPLPLSQKEVRNIDTPPKGTSSPLNPTWSGIFKKSSVAMSRQDESIERQGGSTSHHGLPATSSPAHQVLAASPAPCWIKSPHQDSPTLSPSPLRPPPVAKPTAMATVDWSPFSSVGHVQQRSHDESFWRLEPPTPLPVWNHSSSVVRPPLYPTSVRLMPRGCFSQSSNLVTPSVKMHGTSEREYLLEEIERINPGVGTKDLYTRYSTLTQHPGEDKTNVEVLCTQGGSKSGDAMKNRNCEELVVSIKVCATKGNASSQKITVDNEVYSVPHRKSLRLSKSRPVRKRAAENETENHAEITRARMPPPLPRPGPTTPPPEHASPTTSTGSSNELWCDRYQPVKASELLGNTPQVQQLYQWMAKWKERATAQRDNLVAPGGVASAKPACSKQSASVRTVGNSDGDSDDDFVAPMRGRPRAARHAATSSDSESEDTANDSMLCPVALLCGPHGSGKTAAIHACAQELGFKVFVVDSTTIRSRQNILSVLREATLSHQVAKQLSAPIASDQISVQPVTKKTKPSRTSANNLLSFFKTGDPTTVSSRSHSKGGKCREGGRGEECTDEGGRGEERKHRHSKDELSSTSNNMLSPPQSSEVTLVVATVIVLEEVDILFEDEKGFWSTIYEIIATTKRPVVMTSNADLLLDCDHMKIVFSHPPLEELITHIQVLCLAHGVVLSRSEAKELAIYLGQDTRKMLNTLQYWLPTLPLEGQRGTGAGNGYARHVGIDSLIGLTYQQASLLKHALCPSTQLLPAEDVVDTAAILSEALLMVQSRQLCVNICLNCGERPSKHSSVLTEEAGGVAHHHVSFPWRALNKQRGYSQPATSLALLSDFLDTLSEVDMLNVGNQGMADLAQQAWWTGTAGLTGSGDTAYCEQVLDLGIPAAMEGLALAAMTGRSCDHHCTSHGHDYYGLLASPSNQRHHEAVHTGQMQCCEVFDAQTEMSRSALVVDCLPMLHLLCRSENTRENGSTQRRFRHYLQSSTVDTKHLKLFAKTATLHTISDLVTNTHTLP